MATKKKYKLKFRFKITSIRDGRAKTLRFNDENSVRVYLRMRGYRLAKPIPGEASRSNIIHAYTFLFYSSNGDAANLARVVDRHGKAFLSALCVELHGAAAARADVPPYARPANRIGKVSRY